MKEDGDTPKVGRCREGFVKWRNEGMNVKIYVRELRSYLFLLAAIAVSFVVSAIVDPGNLISLRAEKAFIVIFLGGVFVLSVVQKGMFHRIFGPTCLLIGGMIVFLGAGRIREVVIFSSVVGLVSLIPVVVTLMGNLRGTLQIESEEIGENSALKRNYAIIGIVIFLLVGSIAYEGLLHEVQWLWTNDRFSERLQDSPVETISIADVQPADKEYLQACLSLVNDLRLAGAKVVMLPFPQEFELTTENYALLEQLKNSGMVVFGISPLGAAQWFLPSRSINHPTLFQLELPWGVVSTEFSVHHPTRFVPYEYRVLSSSLTVADVSLELLRKYADYPEDLEIEKTRTSMKLGDYEIPVFRDGFTYSPTYFSTPNDLTIFALYDKSELKTSYTQLSWSARWVKQPIANPAKVLTDIYNNKMVIASPSRSISGRGVESYEGIILSIIRRKLVIPLDSWNEVLILLSIAFAAIVSYKFPSFYSAVVLGGCAIVIFFVGILLFIQFKVFVETSYMILAIVLWVLVSPIAKLAHKRSVVEEKEKRRLQEELRAAHDMQMSLMPAQDPEIIGYDISGLCQPAMEVGGDFYDYVWLNKQKTQLGIALADVSGKAMKAAMTAVMTSGMIYREVGSNESPKTILRKINRPMYLKTDRRVFTAMCFAVLDTKKKKLSLSNAGQTFPVLLRNGSVEYLRVAGERLPLGVKEDVLYQEREIKLKKGDVVVFYTDGVTEAMNEKAELFGEERLEELLKTIDIGQPAKEIVAAMFKSLEDYSRGAKQHDDMTVVVVMVL